MAADGGDEGGPLERAEALRLEGNELLKGGDFAGASKAYQDGLLAVVRCGGEGGDEAARVSAMRLALHLNASLAELKRGNFASAVDHASGALAADLGSAKALYRRAQARSKLAEHGLGGEHEAKLACEDLERALELEPANAEVRSKLKELRSSTRAEQKEKDKSQRENFKGIFSGQRALYDGPMTPGEAPPVLRNEGNADRPIVVSTENLAFSYVRGEPVLTDMNIELRSGWCTGLVGNNAEGKTTLARLILGSSLRPNSGKIVHHPAAGADRGASAGGGGGAAFGAVAAAGAAAALGAAAVAAQVLSGAGGAKEWRRAAASASLQQLALLGACVAATLISVLLLLFWRHTASRSGIRHKVVHCTSETSDKEAIRESSTLEAAIGSCLPKRLGKEERERLVIAMLKAANFQMYNQETGNPVGSPEEYVRDGLRYGQLSGGQKHLIYILRCFAQRPDVLLCDELLGGLDALRQPRVLHMLVRLMRETGAAVLYISTELHQISLVSDSLGFVSGGRMVELGRASDVLDSPKHPVAKDYIGAYRSLPGCHNIGGKLAEAFAGVKDDAALKANWLPPRS